MFIALSRNAGHALREAPIEAKGAPENGPLYCAACRFSQSSGFCGIDDTDFIKPAGNSFSTFQRKCLITKLPFL
jgi:hypothetical protein